METFVQPKITGYRQLNEAKVAHADVHEMFARLIERAHGIGGNHG